MREELEMASFRGNDSPLLVQASLACRACLSSQVDWALSEDDTFEPQVEISCRDCGYRRTVSLTGDQALRLALDDRHS